MNRTLYWFALHSGRAGREGRTIGVVVCPITVENDFDPLEHEQALEECGVPRSQAMVHAKGLARVASRCLGMCGVKQAIAPLVVRMDNLEAELHELKAEFHDFKNTVEERLNRLERNSERLEAMLKMHLALLTVLITMVGGVLVKQFIPS